MRLEDITPTILTYNEEPNIGRALEKLSWARQVLVVDSFSTDRTLEIARANPRVVIHQRPFDHFAGQWNYAFAQVHTSWTLALDADYILSDELITELANESRGDQRDGYEVRFRYCVNGNPLRGTLYPPHVVLFRTDRGRCEVDGHAQRLRVNGTVGRLAGVIYHDDRKPLSVWLRAQDGYASLEVRKLTSVPRAALSRVDRIRLRKWLAPLVIPLYCLLVKGLVLDGQAGIFYTLQRTYAELLLALRLFEFEQARAVARNEQKATPLIEASMSSAPSERTSGSAR